MKRNLKSIVLVLGFVLSLSGCSRNNDGFKSVLEQNGYEYYVEQSNQLDKFKHVHLSSDHSYFDFTYYDDENYMSFEFCDKQLGQCFVKKYDIPLVYFKNHYLNSDMCISLYKRNQDAFHQLSDIKCDTFDSDELLLHMEDEFEKLAMDMDTLIQYMISLSS